MWGGGNQAILTCGAASERNFLIKSDLANKHDYFLAKNKKKLNGFVTKMHIMTYFLICLSQ